MISQPPQENGPDMALSAKLAALRVVDGKAWKDFVNHYDHLIMHWCRRAGLQLGDVPDLVQDVFLRVVLNLHRFHANGRPGSFEAWLKKLTTSAVADFFRVPALAKLAGQQGVAAGESSPGDAPAAIDSHADAALCRAERQVRAELGDRDWTIFCRSVVQGESAD